MKQVKNRNEKRNSQYWSYDLSHGMCRAHVSARNTRSTEKKKTGRVPIKDMQNRSVPTFPSHRHCLKRRAGKNMLIDMATRWRSICMILKRLLELKCVVQDLGSQEFKNSFYKSRIHLDFSYSITLL